MKTVNNPAEYRNNMMIRLMAGPCYVIFEKKDGSIRHMLCTLHNQLIPQDTPADHDRSKKYTRKVNDNVISVWDLNEKGWRSYIIDNVKFFNELNKVSATERIRLKEEYK